jgi:membrane protein implicated in regulation of membrane protease activity
LKINDKIFRFKASTIIKKGDYIVITHIKGITMYVEKGENKNVN